MEILLFLPLLLILMYVLLIRPQQQRVRQQQALLKSIDVGDEVVTVSGIVGIVEAIEDDRVYIEVAPGVTIAMLRQALGRKVEQPTEPDEDVGEDLDDEVDDNLHEGHEETGEESDEESPEEGAETSGHPRDRRTKQGPEEIAG
ncbi:MAG TPA: preprotein translocase subunit YajC [Acidimicrobiales bacterium]|nr:preprotein translocase subunit YajC [Acidimicrobiales bacterium]